ncbi:right-handed parallel beta-helix repeat-containing protein [Kordia jejudonensis]|uniref:right-handed parallel beta-helix repeat-containing protein n=1 Tax=Kordia jejudonensis TaxID=1348245 RepID=UPI0006293E31|nr:right-handed parallel beta-helix repeat-containing protein [Kordia jejudonensis]
MSKVYFLIIIFLISFTLVNAQVEYYIDENGTATTESNAGTQTNPYGLDYFYNNLWFSFATTNNGTTTTLFLKGAFEIDTSLFIGGSNKKYNLTIDSWDIDGDGIGDGGAVIRPDSSLDSSGGLSFTQMFTLNDSENITIRNLTFQGSTNYNTSGLSLLNVGYNNNLTIDNCVFEDNYGQSGIALNVFGMGDNITIRNCSVTRMRWIDNPQTPPTAGSSGIFIVGNENDGPITNLVVENNSVTDLINGFAENITVTGYIDGFTIQNNVVSNNGNIGIAIAGHYPEVQDCDFSVNPPCVPMDFGKNQTRNGVVRKNTILNNNQPTFADAGIYCDGCRDVVIEQNFIKGGDVGISIGCENGGDFENQLSASNVTVINNKIIGNSGAGLYVGSSLNSSPSNVGRFPSTVMNCLIRNNTFYKNGSQGEVYIGRSQNNDFHNNILYMSNPAFAFVVFDNQPFSAFSMDYNLFFRDNLNSQNLIFDSDGSQNGDISNENQNSSFGDPNFADSTNDDFTISDPSSAINVGMPNTTIITSSFLNGYYGTSLNLAGTTTEETDFYNNLRIFSNTIIDIGAHESESMALSTPEFSEETFQIYPNPTDKCSFITIKNNFIGQIKVTVYSSIGTLISSPIIFEKTQIQKTKKLDFVEYPSGLYIVILEMGDIKQYLKVIKD